MNIISKIATVSLVMATLSAKAQNNKWKELTLTNEAEYQAKGITVKIYKETYEGLEGQQYTVKFTNTSTQKLKITGTLSARTYCDNTVSASIDVTIKPGQSLGGNDYLMDNVGLTGTVHSEDCKTDKIYPNPNDKNTYKYDRIRSIGLAGMSITPIVDESSNVVENQITNSSNKVAVKNQAGSAANNRVVQNTIPAGQSAQQAGYQQQANNYLNAAGTADNDIQKAMDLNLAKINATASGNRTQVAQIQQQQNYQSAQQTQAVTNAVTDVVTGLMDAKFNRDREKMQEQNERFEKYRAEQANIAENKRAPIVALLNLINQDQINLSQAATPSDVLKYVNNINRRYVKIDTIDNADSFALLNPGDAARPVVELPKKKETPIIGSYYSIDVFNKDKNLSVVGDFLKNYNNGKACLHGVYKKVPIDIAKGVTYLKEAEKASLDTGEKRITDLHFHNMFATDNCFYTGHYEKLQGDITEVGYKGLSHMTASALIGDVYSDSAKTSQQFQYLDLAFQQYAKSINYYFTYLHSYYQANKGKTKWSERDRHNYPDSYQAAFNNLILVSNDIAQAAINGTDEQKLLAYNAAEFCKKACEAYYGFRVASHPAPIAVNNNSVTAYENLYQSETEKSRLFLTQNTQRKNVVVLPSGLQYEMIRQGSGPIAKKGTTVKLHMRGVLLDGTELDNTYKNNSPIETTAGVGQLIKGFDEAILHMPVGSKSKVYIPAQLAYGQTGNGPIPANSMLIYELEILSIN